MTTREEKLEVIKRWMEYFYLTFDDLDMDGVNSLSDMTDEDIKSALESAEEDRSRHITNGVFIREDWTEAE